MNFLLDCEQVLGWQRHSADYVDKAPVIDQKLVGRHIIYTTSGDDDTSLLHQLTKCTKFYDPPKEGKDASTGKTVHFNLELNQLGVKNRKHTTFDAFCDIDQYDSELPSIKCWVLLTGKPV
jgi:hypothetical protein